MEHVTKAHGHLFLQTDVSPWKGKKAQSWRRLPDAYDFTPLRARKRKTGKSGEESQILANRGKAVSLAPKISKNLKISMEVFVLDWCLVKLLGPGSVH